MNAHLESLEPTLLWQHFRTFCDTPRPSWHEAEILGRIEDWADARGLFHERDEAGNLLIRKPATAGCEHAPTVALQGHVDMVAEADAGVSHDFHADPIETFIQDGWLCARGTTLGADNGVGAAAALAVLDEPDLVHGPLEVLLTFAEEVSLVGAARLAPDWLKASLLLNLDTEEDGEVCIGCAGGANVASETVFERTTIGADETVVRIGIAGLTGGHSGMDIATGRANANRLLARVLHALEAHGLRLVDYDGGRMDNAITRTARATVAVPDEAFDELTATLVELEQQFRRELAGVDDNVSVSQDRAEAEHALGASDSRRLIRLLYALPYGVERMSQAAPGVVETSNNIGVVQLAKGVFKTQIMVRSLVDSARDAHVERIATLFDLADIPVTRERGYPGWTPRPDSPLLERFIALHERLTGARPEVKTIHAGLECGLIGAKYPGLDMISFGPTIRGAHSPSERVDIATVESFYTLLKASIAECAQRI